MALNRIEKEGIARDQNGRHWAEVRIKKDLPEYDLAPILKPMKLSLGLFAIAFWLTPWLIGCGPLPNSSSADKYLYGEGITGTQNFLEARAVLAMKCFNCHSVWATWDEAAMLAQGIVSRGSPSGSQLYTIIIGNDSGDKATMPKMGPLLTDIELQKMKTWILNM